MVLKLPQDHEGSEYVFSFEIGQREGGFYSARPDGQKHPVLYSNIDIYLKKRNFESIALFCCYFQIFKIA